MAEGNFASMKAHVSMNTIFRYISV